MNQILYLMVEILYWIRKKQGKGTKKPSMTKGLKAMILKKEPIFND